MRTRHAQARQALRLSLACVWLLTAWVSVHDRAARGRTLLAEAGLPDVWHLPLIWAGSLWDMTWDWPASHRPPRGAGDGSGGHGPS